MGCVDRGFGVVGVNARKSRAMVCLHTQPYKVEKLRCDNLSNCSFVGGVYILSIRKQQMERKMKVSDIKVDIRLALLSLGRDAYIKLPTSKVELAETLKGLRAEQRAVGGILKA